MDDFERQFLKGYRQTTIQVVYFLPDFDNILQEFIWQYLDVRPNFPRTHQFLNYWQHNVEAVINNIYLAHCDTNITHEFIKVNHLFEINTIQ